MAIMIVLEIYRMDATFINFIKFNSFAKWICVDMALGFDKLMKLQSGG